LRHARRAHPIPANRRVSLLTSPRTRSLWRNCATSTGTRGPRRTNSVRWGERLSGGNWPRDRRIGSGRAFATIRLACGEPWRSNRSGPLAREAGSCPRGCAISSPTSRHPRSPKARDRGHPHQDRILLRSGPPAAHFSPPLPSVSMGMKAASRAIGEFA
jgi:hypothetical protein